MKKKEMTTILGVVAILLVAAVAVVVIMGTEDASGDGSIVELGVSVEGAKIGLAVPGYVIELGITSIADLEANKASFDNKIVGIDAGAGIMMASEDAIDAYGLSLTLQQSSSVGMLSALDAAFNSETNIVVTMWSPHWAVAKYNLTYLEDPEGSFGGAEYIGTIANSEWATNNPDAAAIGERFNWTMDDISGVMLAIEEGATAAQAAQDWIDANPTVVSGWIDGVEGTGTIKIGMVNWECAVASSNVMKLVLEEAGFTVELVETDAGIMYVGLSTGASHISTTAWAPLTHQSYYEQYGIVPVNA